MWNDTLATMGRHVPRRREPFGARREHSRLDSQVHNSRVHSTTSMPPSGHVVGEGGIRLLARSLAWTRDQTQLGRMSRFKKKKKKKIPRLLRDCTLATVATSKNIVVLNSNNI